MAGSENHYTLGRPTFDDPVKILIVRSPYYKEISDNLLRGASAEVESVGGTWDVVDVPGALEIPAAIGIAERMKDYHGYVALGCVIRGETNHYDIVAENSAKSLSKLGLDGICIGNGILTVDNHEQAIERSDPKLKNKGKDAAKALISLLLIKQNYNNDR